MTDHRPRTEDELVELVRSIDVHAPPDLRARVEQMIAEAPARRRLRVRAPAARSSAGRVRARPFAAALATAAVVAVLAVVLASGGGARHTLSLTSAAKTTLLAATTPAPTRSDHSPFLAVAVGGVQFPYLEDAFGWRSSGTRADTVDGRAVTTVFYSRGAARIGYAIYAGVPSPASRDGTVLLQDRTRFRVLSQDGTSIISWTRGGHLCVMSSHGASMQELIRLAGCSGRDTLAA
ncbi:MAG TPA: hypothetical protein VH115_04610 [Solirubrobacteraceae bacterium]|nr:hypothetical protein [Solirubrobacteraceae bacterium]